MGNAIQLAAEVQAPPAGPETRAYLDLLHTHGSITTRSADLYKGHGLTEQQYHVLRVLAEAGPDGLSCFELSERLPTPAPDVTRLIERLQRARLATRRRCAEDRRVVRLELTDRGRCVLRKLGPVLARFHRDRLAHMSQQELDLLTRLLRKARGADG
jgi:DNA-binding MarR family transcriptional regulator